MVTERTTEYSGVCPCGNGTLDIECCSSDNGYTVYADTYESHVMCANCRKMYGIQQLGKAFHLVYRSEVEAIARKNAEYSAAAAKLAEEARRKGILSNFAQQLDSQKSIAAIYRIIANNKLTNNSLATFRKNWTNGEAYLRAHVSGYNVKKVLSAIKCDDESLVKAAENVRMLEQEAYAKPSVIQPPFHIVF